jgi:hypothetical protein
VKTKRNSFRFTLILSALAGIILPLILTGRPIDWNEFFYIMASSFSLVWAIYSIILLGYVFLVEGRRRGNKSKTAEEVGPFPPKLIQEWQALGEITINKDHWDQKNKLWN